MQRSPENELHRLRKQAEAFAELRGERPSTAHLLHAVLEDGGTARALLEERRIDGKAVMAALRVVTDDEGDAVPKALARAKEFAGRQLRGVGPERGGSDPSLVLLHALCQEQKSASYRFLQQVGVDIARLRSTVLQYATGVTTPRRVEASRETAQPVRPSSPPISSAGASSASKSLLNPLPDGTRKLPSRPSANAFSTLAHRPGLPAQPLARPNAPAEKHAARMPLVAGPKQGELPLAKISPGGTASGGPPNLAGARPKRPQKAGGNAPNPGSAPASDGTTTAVSGSPVNKVPTHPTSTALSLRLGAPPGVVAPPTAEAVTDSAAPKLGSAVPAEFPRLHVFATEPGTTPFCLGRDRDLARLVELLHKKNGHHALVVGDPAVGKTTLLAEAAERLRAAGTTVLFVDVAAILGACPARGQLAATLRELDQEAAAWGKRNAKTTSAATVLLLDDAAALFTAEAEAETSAALRKLATPSVSWVLALSTAEAKRCTDRDPTSLRQFGVVDLAELDLATATKATHALVQTLADHHGVTYDEDAIEDAVRWTARWSPGKPNPEKSLVLLDRAGARTRLLGHPSVARAVVAKALSEETRVPVERLLESDGERLLALESHVGRILVGHESPVAKMADILRRNASGFRSGRPIGSFLLLGPTGVGKTECAKALAEVLFGSEHAMTRIDLSEYSEPHSVARLFGAPPGYVGHEAGGQLTEAVAKRPYQLVLLDEVEKAHRDVLLAFLQVFDEGHLTDGRGKSIDFSNTVILLTSNLGADQYGKKVRAKLGFGAATVEDDSADRDAEVVAAARRALAPELYNRLDEVLVFAPLERREVREVARRMLARTGQALHAEKGVTLDVAEEAIEALLDLGGYDPSLGARPMRRTIAREVEARIATLVLRGELRRGDVALLEAHNGKISLDILKKS